MSEKPMILTAESVRAILENRKTQIRRVINPQPEEEWHPGTVGWYAPTKVDRYGVEYPGKEVFGASDENEGRICPHPVGSRIWVRETWTGNWCYERMHIVYATSGSERFLEIPDVPADYGLPKVALKTGNWITPIFMPRWASRITLEVTEVRAQRLQDISEEDIKAEGVIASPDLGWNERKMFHLLWNSLNAKRGYGWDANPWVFAYTFKVVKP